RGWNGRIQLSLQCPSPSSADADRRRETWIHHRGANSILYSHAFHASLETNSLQGRWGITRPRLSSYRPCAIPLPTGSSNGLCRHRVVLLGTRHRHAASPARRWVAGPVAFLARWGGRRSIRDLWANRQTHGRP